MTFKNKTSGFTLVEMMIVICIIMMLLGLALFPYRYYMQRGYTERAADHISQEWILAHQAIRSGLEFDIGKHARLFWVINKESSIIDAYLQSGSTIPDLATLGTSSSDIRKYKSYTLDDGVKVLDFTGSLYGIGDRVGYMISPPYGDGVFFTGTLSSGSMTDARIIVGYPGSDGVGRSREILLRTYLK